MGDVDMEGLRGRGRAGRRGRRGQRRRSWARGRLELGESADKRVPLASAVSNVSIISDVSCLFYVSLSHVLYALYIIIIHFLGLTY